MDTGLWDYTHVRSYVWVPEFVGLSVMWASSGQGTINGAAGMLQKALISPYLHQCHHPPFL